MWNDIGSLVAMGSFFLFMAFFVALVWWLQRETAREGYPLVTENSTHLRPYPLSPPGPKTFRLPHGQGDVVVANGGRKDAREIAARAPSRVAGTPLDPTGDPLADGVGPAAWAERAKRPELDSHGEVKIVPMSGAPAFAIVKGDVDPRGLPVIAADRRQAGVVSEIWIDRAEQLIRYLEVTTAGGRKVLLPIAQAVIGPSGGLFGFGGGKTAVMVDAVTAEQFENAPGVAAPDRVTLYEEERVVAYFGGGYLYATPSRKESQL